MKLTPRQELEKLSKANGNEGFYGTSNQFSNLITARLEAKAIKLLRSIFRDVLPMNERLEYFKIYDMLLDGKSEKSIRTYYKG